MCYVVQLRVDASACDEWTRRFSVLVHERATALAELKAQCERTARCGDGVPPVSPWLEA